MRRTLKRSAAALMLLAVLVSVALLAGLVVPRTAADFAQAPERAASRHEIVLIANPIHTDIALPATPQVLERLAFLGAAGLPIDHPDLGAILIGWGGRQFYTQTPTWGDLTARSAFASVTLDDSVLRFALVPPLIPDFPGTRRLSLSDEQFEALLAFIEATLTRDEAGAPIVIEGAGYTPFDRFFEAEGWFNIALGCNVWTAAALGKAGISTGFWTPLPQTLLRSIDWHE